MFTIKSLPLKKHQIALPLLVIILSTLAFICDVDSLAFQRDLFIEGEFWRGLTGHFLHTNFNHFILNIIAVILLWALHGQFYNLVNYTLIFLVCAITTTFGVYIYSPEIMQYVGLSGVLHGLFIWGAIKDIQNKDKTGFVLLVAVIGKVIHEQIKGASKEVADLISATVAIDAHLWGMIGGGVIGLLSLYHVKKSKKQL
ncbi:rhombosortase [Colwellia sp. UCD-KL20]|uniref:rhombosortase n=1 Tax=Colwellia sp. UCD-KL20 TaxID=1917165 RepID=UPI0009FB02DA|nr:rhombosortase [Colwellia sp. UCD-KL20]